MILDEIKLFVLSAAPFGLYAAIPAGIELYKFSVWKSAIISISGNMFTAAFIFGSLVFTSRYLIDRSKTANNILDKIYSKTRKKYGEKYRLLGAISLITFVATPAPGAGARTGIIPAFVFGVGFFKSFALVLIGLCIKAFYITLSIMGIKVSISQIMKMII